MPGNIRNPQDTPPVTTTAEANKRKEIINKNRSQIANQFGRKAGQMISQGREIDHTRFSNSGLVDDHDQLVGKSWDDTGQPTIEEYKNQMREQNKDMGNNPTSAHTVVPQNQKVQHNQEVSKEHQQIAENQKMDSSETSKILQSIDPETGLKKDRQDELPKEAVEVHPILQDLRRSFGIKNRVKPITVNLAGKKWTMVALNGTLEAYVGRLADMLGLSPTEREYKMSMLYAATSVIKINDVPLYKIFDVKIKDINPATIDPEDPPLAVRQVSSHRLAEELLDHVIPDLGNQLYQKYEQQILPLTTINMEEVEQETEEKIWIFKCPMENCENQRKGLRFTEDGSEKNYYCPDHGIMLKPIMTEQDQGDYPLP